MADDWVCLACCNGNGGGQLRCGRCGMPPVELVKASPRKQPELSAFRSARPTTAPSTPRESPLAAVAASPAAAVRFLNAVGFGSYSSTAAMRHLTLRELADMTLAALINFFRWHTTLRISASWAIIVDRLA